MASNLDNEVTSRRALAIRRSVEEVGLGLARVGEAVPQRFSIFIFHFPMSGDHGREKRFWVASRRATFCSLSSAAHPPGLLFSGSFGPDALFSTLEMALGESEARVLLAPEKTISSMAITSLSSPSPPVS